MLQSFFNLSLTAGNFMPLISRESIKGLYTNISNFSYQAYSAIELKSIVVAGVAFTAHKTPANASSIISNKEIAKIIDMIRKPLLIMSVGFLFIRFLAILINHFYPQKSKGLPPPNTVPQSDHKQTPLQLATLPNAPIQEPLEKQIYKINNIFTCKEAPSNSRNYYDKEFLTWYNKNTWTPKEFQILMSNPKFIILMNRMNFSKSSILHATCDKPGQDHAVEELLNAGAVLEMPVYPAQDSYVWTDMPCIMTDQQIQKLRDVNSNIPLPKHTLIQNYRPTVNAILQMLETPSKQHPPYPSITPVLNRLTPEEKTELLQKLQAIIQEIQINRRFFPNRVSDIDKFLFNNILDLLIFNQILIAERKRDLNHNIYSNENRLMQMNMFYLKEKMPFEIKWR